MTVHGEDVSFRDVKIKIPDSNVTWGCEWRHAPEAWAEDFGEFEKKSVSWVLPRGRRLIFARSPRPCGRCHTWFGADGKVRCISLLMSKNLLNSKVVKSFVPELRNRKCFCVSWFLFSIYMVMNILCIFNIFMYDYVTLIVCIFSLCFYSQNQSLQKIFLLIITHL